MPTPFFRYSETTKWAFAHIPLAQFIHRLKIAAKSEIRFPLFRKKGNNRLGKSYADSSKNYMKGIVPARYHHLIIPTYPIGCKRIVRDRGYLESLNRPNVRLTFDHIASVEPDGVIMATGEKVPLDVIICGTGFIADNYPFNLRGTRSTLKEYNDAHGGPMAYLGSTVPGFPNLFMSKVRTRPPVTRPSSHPKSCKPRTSCSSWSPCAPVSSQVSRPRTQRRTSTTPHCKRSSKISSGHSAHRGIALGPTGAVASSICSPVRSCYCGGGCEGYAGRTTRSRVPARRSGAVARREAGGCAVVGNS